MASVVAGVDARTAGAEGGSGGGSGSASGGGSGSGGGHSGGVNAPQAPKTTARVLGWQLLGFDFVVDSDYRVHVVEVNGSPGAAKTLQGGLADATARLVASALQPNALSDPSCGAIPPNGITAAASDDASLPDGVPSCMCRVHGHPMMRGGGGGVWRPSLGVCGREAKQALLVHMHLQVPLHLL